jgi:bifunctional DNA-binding transcriptional regulator/antitoxin component of YhaV-PrlF toxin-antitoxin module
VPKAIRDALGVRPGDEIEFVPRDGDIFVEVRPRPSVLEFAGIASHAADALPATGEEIDELIERGMAEAAVARSAGSRSGSRRSR